MVVFVYDGVAYAGDIGVSDSGDKLRENWMQISIKIFIHNKIVMYEGLVGIQPLLFFLLSTHEDKFNI